MPVRPQRPALALLAGLTALSILALSVMLPPRRASVEGRWTPQLRGERVRGAYHVHTVRSDGTGTPEEVARAAGRAALDFVILTDHGDATRTPDPPRYVDGVLVIDAVEISTTLGHYVALGVTRASDTAWPGGLTRWPRMSPGSEGSASSPIPTRRGGRCPGATGRFRPSASSG